MIFYIEMINAQFIIYGCSIMGFICLTFARHIFRCIFSIKGHVSHFDCSFTELIIMFYVIDNKSTRVYIIALYGTGNQLGISQYHACWCPGSMYCQIINSYDINLFETNMSPVGQDFYGLCQLSVEKWGENKSMGKCKKDITPVRQQWSYVFLALTHRYISFMFFQKHSAHTKGTDAQWICEPLFFLYILITLGL